MTESHVEKQPIVKDVPFCASSFLMFRTIADPNRGFADGLAPRIWDDRRELNPVTSAEELVEALRARIQIACAGKKPALALSGGIDSAILAKLMPKDTIAYTFKCVVPDKQVTDESQRAATYARECDLEHRIVEVYWEDFEEFAPVLMKHKRSPMHSIEVQIYKAALRAKEDGRDLFVFGESADLNYGGLSDLLSKERTMGEFIDRYNYVQPHHVLKDPRYVMDPYRTYAREDGTFDTHEFCRGFFLKEAMGSYSNACGTAGMELETPYVYTWLGSPIDLERIRRGENKYLVREAFDLLYPGWEIPKKTPMPRPMNEWMENWEGPTRPEFWPHCIDGMTGDQKWLVWALERFLDLVDSRTC